MTHTPGARVWAVRTPTAAHRHTGGERLGERYAMQDAGLTPYPKG